MPASVLGIGTMTARLGGPQPAVREMGSEAIAGGRGELRAVMWESRGPERPVVSEEEWGFQGGPLGDDF